MTFANDIDYDPEYHFSHFVVDFSDYVRKPAHISEEMYEAMAALDTPSGTPPWVPTNPQEFEGLIESRVTYRMADQIAVQRVREIQLGKLPHPYLLPFAQMLDREYEDELLTIGKLWPRGGNILLAAEAKAGKSTLVANLIRSLCDGDAFLGVTDFYVHAIPEGHTLALLDLEMNERRVRDEIAVQQIQNIDKLRVAVLRGQSQSFDITNDEQRVAWIEYLKANNVHTLIIDPIAPLLAQLGVDEGDNFGVAQLFNMLDKVKAEAGIVDMMVVHHTGHTQQWRPRGASRFKDWPDAIWMIRKDGDDPNDPAAPRLMNAYGRDVGLSNPGQLNLDDNKRLTFTDANPTNAVDTGFNRDAAEALVRDHPGETADELFAHRMWTVGQPAVQGYLNHLVDSRGTIHRHQVANRPGTRGARPYAYWYGACDFMCPHHPDYTE